MADFKKAFAEVIKNEGGYVNDPDDPGGETYKGVARNRNASWPGWIRVDMLKQKRGFPDNLASNERLQTEVENLYEINYWHKIRGEQIENQFIAQSIFDFAVNAGPTASAKITQFCAGAKVDGIIGEKTLARLNELNEELFLAKFALAKLARYVQICERNRASRKYFFGWCRRTLEGI